MLQFQFKSSYKVVLGSLKILVTHLLIVYSMYYKTKQGGELNENKHRDIKGFI